ncbi:MAG: hypothetical protein ACQEWI_19800 [Bacillota bacterium]
MKRTRLENAAHMLIYDPQLPITQITFISYLIGSVLSCSFFLIAIGDHLIIFTLLGAIHGWFL